MKVFISWSGERSQILANALHDWLPMVLQSVAPWLSHADISAGERWADSVAKELEASDFGITCITRENMSSPWIHFEAGALAKRMQEGRVIPLLLDIEFKDISGPLTQFQAKKAERGGLLDVVTAINQFSEVKVAEALLPKQFEALWPTFERKINEIPKTQLPAKQQRPQHEILEELVASIRGLDIRFRETIEESPGPRRRRGRMNSMMAVEFTHFSKDITHGRPDLLQLLMLLSLVKDDLPWLYELVVDAYQQAARKLSGAKEARRRVLRAVRQLHDGPGMDLFENKETYLVFREIQHLSKELMNIYENEDIESNSKRLNRRNSALNKQTETT